MSACAEYSPRMKMNARLAPAAIAPMITPSTSRCGLLCISRRSLKVPGSDSSALQQRNLSIEHFVLRHLERRLARRAVAAGRLVDVDQVEPRDVEVGRQDLGLERLAHARGPSVPCSPDRAPLDPVPPSAPRSVCAPPVTSPWAQGSSKPGSVRPRPGKASRFS